ncbi:hypothetical protein C9374_010297 [Naegleria lovaniensis]|uniref:Vesicle transport protein n=1 Tax=Naegleria lovaniensis TaxID=51637 RepID=A0AA88GHF2_NAELO|nr:uncharacterized protein C9374_010297 [Naegleria lovaniensis]KAG2374923.1 hypothetical protein C9374_010297 [Naegleria lovaniensis]
MLVAASNSRSPKQLGSGESASSSSSQSDLFSALSSWSSSIQKTFNEVSQTITANINTIDHSSSSSSNTNTSSSTTTPTTNPSSSSTIVPSASSMTSSSRPSSPTNLNKKQKQMLKEKRPLMRNQDFSSEEDEESMIGSSALKKKSSSTTASESIGDWFSSVQNSITKQFNEWSSPTSSSSNNNTTSDDDGPLAKAHSSRIKSPSTSSSNVASSSNGFMDSLSSTFASIKTQTNDKWTLLRDQFFDNNSQNTIDENDNSFLGRLSKEVDGMITLSAKQRMYGFFMSLGFGLLCIIIALGFLPSILFASGAFAFFYTFGNLLCLVSTFFLVGPVAQIKNMAKPDRAIPSALFIASMVLTLICVFAMPIALLIILLVITQAVGLVWYVISYIPFAQQILGMIFSSFMRIFN